MKKLIFIFAFAFLMLPFTVSAQATVDKNQQKKEEKRRAKDLKKTRGKNKGALTQAEISRRKAMLAQEKKRKKIGVSADGVTAKKKDNRKLKKLRKKNRRKVKR